ncbi:MAG: 2-C-methyl-D-erythritol 4-phosphate cytidylyltransferase [Ignavibacteriaceae bacterium]|jgi:2-C-methyl-D-erythritol 4-phosphate cytidylyltransferase|nr:2-C-methyl-D-erythritol 4-phosphate cytidylyltransferase [Ignavibacteriaceae bacterium]
MSLLPSTINHHPSSLPRIIAIIPAAGKGKRFGGITPKQFLKINGKEILAYTLEVFQKAKRIDEIIVAASREEFPRIIKLQKKYKLTKLTIIVEGGKERQDSVYNALIMADLNKNDLVIVHDAARPLLSQKVLGEAIRCAEKNGNALVCLQAKDTLLKKTKTEHTYLNRSQIYYIQTPQIFRYNQLLSAFEKAKKEKFVGTDESMLVERSGKKINLSEGSPLNFKITTKDDFEMLKRILK